MSNDIYNQIANMVIADRAIPSNIKYGIAIFERGAVSIIDANSDRVEAWVGGLDGKVIEGGGSRRRVEFVATSEGIKSHCTGNTKDHQIFCKHCVGLALKLGADVSRVL